MMKRNITDLPQDIKLFIKNSLQKMIVGQTGHHAIRDRYSDLKSLSNTDSPTIIDAGAHKGDETAAYLDIFPDAEIIAIEPQPDLADSIRERFSGDNRVTVQNVAVGANKKEIEFYQTENRASASARKPTKTKDKYIDSNITKSYTIEQVTLDGLVSEADILKMDLEGHELDTIRGGERILSEVGIILTEVEFVEFNADQPLFGELDRYLRKNGFSLYNFYGLHTEDDGQLTAGDALYRRNDPNSTNTE